MNFLYFLFFYFLATYSLFPGQVETQVKNNLNNPELSLNKNIIIESMAVTWLDSIYGPVKSEGMVNIELTGYIKFKNEKPIYINEFAIVEENLNAAPGALQCSKSVKIIPILNNKLLKKHAPFFKIEGERVVFKIKMEHPLKSNCSGLNTVNFTCQEQNQEIIFHQGKKG
ncbi:MAG: hypothetical protein H0X62_04290 [Bacteroidetes bacterium]|nr:hypothetical protein [Bacteroidota bacterium]